MLFYKYSSNLDELTINSSITFETDKKTIQEIIDHYNNGRLNLTPAFQRESVWSEVQRKRLIKSMLENIPVPSIFLYEHEKEGKIVYDVIDGKQRIESIFMFMGLRGFKKTTYPIKIEWEEDSQERKGEFYWKELKDKEKALIHNYKIQTTIVKCSFVEVANIFVMINSTGSSLTPQEIRKAKYYKSELLRKTRDLAERKPVLEYFIKNKILSKSQIQRQKHIEFVSELLISIINKSVINKKRAVEDAFTNDTIKGKQLASAVISFNDTLKLIKRVFPNISSTRFKNLADFYSIFMLVWKWRNMEKLVLNNPHRNKLTEGYLTEFGYNIDRVRQRHKELGKIDDKDQVFMEYIATVHSNTDDYSQRKRREKILNELLADKFTSKDPNRNFNALQKRIIWHLSDGSCSNCNKSLKFNTFHADHVTAHSKGGKTKLYNAQVLCPSCNIKKRDK